MERGKTILILIGISACLTGSAFAWQIQPPIMLSISTDGAGMQQTTTGSITLSAKIETNYKVVGSFSPLTSLKVTAYQVEVSYPDGTKSYVFTVGSDKSSFVDWHSKQSTVNTYTVSAVLEDGTMIISNSVKVPMGANGEVTTEAALASSLTQNPPRQPSANPPPAPPKTPQTPSSGSGANEAMKGFLSKYARNDLSDADKQKIAEIMKAHQEAMMYLFSISKGNPDVAARMTAQQEKFISDLIPYVASDKVDAFKKDMAPVLPGANRDRALPAPSQSDGLQKTNSGAAQPGMALPPNVLRSLEAKLSRFDTDEKRMAWIESVNTKIDVLMAKVSSSRSKALLQALKELLTRKADEIRQKNDDDAMLNNLLQ